MKEYEKRQNKRGRMKLSVPRVNKSKKVSKKNTKLKKLNKW